MGFRKSSVPYLDGSFCCGDYFFYDFEFNLITPHFIHGYSQTERQTDSVEVSQVYTLLLWFNTPIVGQWLSEDKLTTSGELLIKQKFYRRYQPETRLPLWTWDQKQPRDLIYNVMWPIKLKLNIDRNCQHFVSSQGTSAINSGNWWTILFSGRHILSTLASHHGP